MKKITVGVEGFEEMRKRKQARACKLDQGVKIEPEVRIMFERTKDTEAKNNAKGKGPIGPHA